MFNIKEELNKLPDSPGVYLMKNSDGEIIYVGKAISLKNRVRSYFNNSSKGAKVISMVSHVESFEYILVSNEVEALVLESNFIKEKKPKYNILLRDDKTYPYIAIKNEKFPRLVKTREANSNKDEYFGPYPNAYAANEAVTLLNKIFKLRTCNLNFEKGQRLSRPCLNYYIGMCMGPCIDKADEDIYLENITKVREFLKGKTKDVISFLEEKMNQESSLLRYENAAKYRDYINEIKVLSIKQKITNTNETDADFIALIRGDRYHCVSVFYMRDGKIVDRVNYFMKDDYNESDELVLSSFLKQYYISQNYIPKNINVDIIPDEMELIEEFLTSRAGYRVYLNEVKIGNKKDILNLVKENAKEALKKYESRKRKKRKDDTSWIRTIDGGFIYFKSL